MQVIDNHHPNKKEHPKLTVPLEHKKHQKLHDIEPNDTPLSRVMRQYDKVNTISVTMKNWSASYQKDFDNTPEIGLEKVTLLKKTLTKELTLLVKDDLAKIHIKGLGPRYLAGILAYAHPSRFPSQRKFLFYCGYTQASRINKHYCRRIKPIMYNLVGNIIKAKDPKYYMFYLKFKEDARIRNGNKSKMALHRIAINRTATFVLKEIYKIFRVDNRVLFCSSQLPKMEGLNPVLKVILDLHT
jgi:hypothetical protein